MTAIGDLVHYVARGSADGVFPPACRAALVTEHVWDRAVEGGIRIGAAVVNPTGLFFHPLTDGGLEHGSEPGQWHTPAECPGPS